MYDTTTITKRPHVRMTPEWLWNDPGMTPEWPQNDPGMTREWLWNDPGMTPEWLRNGPVRNDPGMTPEWPQNDNKLAPVGCIASYCVPPVATPLARYTPPQPATVGIASTLPYGMGIPALTSVRAHSQFDISEIRVPQTWYGNRSGDIWSTVARIQFKNVNCFVMFCIFSWFSLQSNSKMSIVLLFFVFFHDFRCNPIQKCQCFCYFL